MLTAKTKHSITKTQHYQKVQTEEVSRQFQKHHTYQFLIQGYLAGITNFKTFLAQSNQKSLSEKQY